MDTANAANQYSHGYGQGAQSANLKEPPRTLASASSRLDGINERLSKVCESLSAISSQLGALSPVAGETGGKPTVAVGAVDRLNEAANAAHLKLSEIESMIQSVQRALG